MGKHGQRLWMLTALFAVIAAAIIAVALLQGSGDSSSPRSKEPATKTISKPSPGHYHEAADQPPQGNVGETNQGDDQEVPVTSDSPFVTGYDQDGDGFLDGVVPVQAEIPETPADGDCGYITKDFPYGDTAKAYVRIDGSVGCTVARLVIYDAVSPSSGFDGTLRGWTCIPEGETTYNEICSKPAPGGLATIKSVRTTWI